MSEQDPPQALPARTSSWHAGRVVGELSARLGALERRFDAFQGEQLRRLDRVVAYVDHQEREEAEKKQATEARDVQMRGIAEHQRALNAWLFPILGGMLVALVGLLASRLAQDVPRSYAYGIIAGLVVVLITVIVTAAARARAPRTGRP